MVSRFVGLIRTSALALVAVGALVESELTAADDGFEPADTYCDSGQQSNRRRPGSDSGSNGRVDKYKLPKCETISDLGIEPWFDKVDLGPPVPDRWRIVEAIGIETNLWDPYNGHNPLKGDMPV